jgi:hypothetical protein
MIPPDPRNWWDLWWNHLIPQLSTISHQWQYIGGKLWNQRKCVEEEAVEVYGVEVELLRRHGGEDFFFGPSF